MTINNTILPIILCDTVESHENLLPLSYTRPASDFRIGIDTIADKWRDMSGRMIGYVTPDYLSSKFHSDFNSGEALYVVGNLLPSKALVEAVLAMPVGTALWAGDSLIAVCGRYDDFVVARGERIEFDGQVDIFKYVFDIFLLNGKAVTEDFFRLTAGRSSQPLSSTNTLIGDSVDAAGRSLIFIEEGAKVEGAFLNVTEGPIYIGKDAEIMEGACLRGPIALCDHAHVNMGAKVYGKTTIGPYCKVGGEVNNVVMFGYSNKSHDGFLGNAVIGEWCNIGAGVNASNLKNDYSKIRIWNYATRTFMRTDLQFCGLIMGDHSKIGINVMLNTATVIGVGVNLHGAGFPRTFIPSFSEGSPSAGFSEVAEKKFHDIARRVMSRRGLELTAEDTKILDWVREKAASLR